MVPACPNPFPASCLQWLLGMFSPESLTKFDLPAHDRDFHIFINSSTMAKRWDKSPTSLKTFIFTNFCGLRRRRYTFQYGCRRRGVRCILGTPAFFLSPESATKKVVFQFPARCQYPLAGTWLYFFFLFIRLKLMTVEVKILDFKIFL